MAVEHYLQNELRTLECGMAFAKVLQPGDCVFLEGDLGAGKTTFVRGILRGLGYTDLVRSPSYTIVESYESLGLWHLDLYRLTSPAEWIERGLSDYFTPKAIVCIEWPERAGVFLPEPTWHVHMRITLPGRTLSMVSSANRWCGF